MVEIPLKQKYRVGGTSRYKSPSGTNAPKRDHAEKRRGARQKAAPIPMLMIIGPTGKRRMMRADS